MKPARLVLEPETRHDGLVRRSAVLLHGDGTEDRLWWELPDSLSACVTSHADPWVIGLLFPIMQSGAPVHIEGTVSPSLLANLELFMRIWAIWVPGKYRPAALTADAEVELPPVAEPNMTVASLSCGADSCFSLYRHVRKLAGRRTLRIGATVAQHGFDVMLDATKADDIFGRLFADATTLSGSVGLPCFPMKTNFRQMRMDWTEAWATQLVSGLTLLAGRYDTALIANDMPYQWLNMAWPSHPVTNPLLGSRGFTVVDDGGDFSRFEKAKVIAGWPEAMRHLHVCFGVDHPGTYQNCCRCEKCIRTILSFRVAGCARPAAFPHDPTDDEIRSSRLHLVTRLYRWEQLAKGAEDAGLGQTGWAKAIRAVVRRRRWRDNLERFLRPFIPLRNKIRKIVRGSELSRRELARRAGRG